MACADGRVESAGAFPVALWANAAADRPAEARTRTSRLVFFMNVSPPGTVRGYPDNAPIRVALTPQACRRLNKRLCLRHGRQRRFPATVSHRAPPVRLLFRAGGARSGARP